MKPSLILALALIAVTQPVFAEEKPVVLPITGIVLFSSGVGYFVHDGSVAGDARMDLEFPTAGINDILKSMILRDFQGGTISGVTFTSRDPITRTLQSFSLDLTGNPGIAGILAQARGRAVELTVPDVVRGTIIGVESQTQVASSGTELTVYLLDLLTAQGIRSIPLSQIKGIKFLDAQVQNDLTAALALIATSRDLDKKTVTLHFSGAGTRKVQVGYLQETPIWKMSYRLALGEDKSPLLQGWAIVENATEGDWKNVALSLVSGKPITFAMDLYTSLYVNRPTVTLDLGQSVQPQTYGMALEDKAFAADQTPSSEIARAPSAPAAQSPSPVVTSGAAGGVRASSLGEGVTSAASASTVGELFQYVIQKAVNLPRRQSALFPIVNQTIGGEKFSIFNESVDAARPLNAVRLSNSTAQFLMQGPVAVFDGGVYAGDAMLTALPAGSQQFISYAMDLETEVKVQSTPTPQDLFMVTVSKGIVTTMYKLTREKDYIVQNRGGRAKSVIIEHRIDSSWTLVSPKDPMERSRDVYRFLLPVDPGKSKQLAVIEERMTSQTVSASNLSADTIALFMRSTVVKQAVKDALQKLVALKQKAADAKAQRVLLEGQVQAITQEQARIRANMGELDHGNALYNRYVTQLNDQENQLAALQESITKARAEEAARQKDVDAFLLGMDVS